MSGNPRAPELNPDFAWLNTDRPLTFAKELVGQVALLDFWTCHEGRGVCVPARTAWNVPVRFEDAGDAAAELTAAVA